jgi:hypothetical protein
METYSYQTPKLVVTTNMENFSGQEGTCVEDMT